MKTARLFRNGSGRAVRLSKDCRFEGDEVVIEKVGDALMLFPKRYDARALGEILDSLDDDCVLAREQPATQQARRFDR